MSIANCQLHSSQPNQNFPDTETNISEFNYLAESAKVEFQWNVSSLLELRSELNARISKAQEQRKDGVYFLNSEVEVINDWLLQTSTSLLENYALIDRTLRKTNLLYRAATRIHLKDLVA